MSGLKMGLNKLRASAIRKKLNPILLSHFFALVLSLSKDILRARLILQQFENDHGYNKGSIMRIFILSLTLLSTHICATQTPNNNPTFHNNNNPTISPSFAPVTTISPQFINTTSIINEVSAQIKDITVTLIQKAQETFNKDNYNTAKNLLKTLLWEYRYNIAAGTLLTGYSGTNVVLLHDYHYLKDTQRWSCWKQDCTFELLCAIPHAELTQELIRSIGESHYNKKNPNDASHPLITFIATIEKEIKICKRYLKIADIIKKLHLIKFFPINDAKINEVNKFLERCLFIRHLFLSWLTERNLINKSRKKVSSAFIKMPLQSVYCP